MFKLIFVNLRSSFSAGHFTQMACDRVTEVGECKLYAICFSSLSLKVLKGCAMVKYTRSGWKTALITCDYSSANVMNFLIYSGGKTASKCSTGVNSKYPGLCSENETVDSNLLKTSTWSVVVKY